MKSNPRTHDWSGLTIADAATGTTRRLVLPADDLANLLPPSPHESISLGWVETTPDKTTTPGLELSAKATPLLTIPQANLTPAHRHHLSARTVIVWDAATDLPRLADASGQWPTSYHCLTTMLRLLGNRAVPEGTTTDNLVPEIRVACEQRDLIPAYGWGNPTLRRADLCDALLKELDAAKLLATYLTECALLPVTHAMSRRGIGVDRARLEAVLAKYQASTDEAANRLHREAGSPSLNPDDATAVLAALRALGLQITGTDKEALCGVNHPAVVALQDYRAAHGVHSAARAILDALDSGDRFHPRWDALGTGTGRFACSAPAFQGLPNNPDLRACVVPSPDFEFVRCDYSQADLRPLTAASQDPEMLAIFREGRDFHRETAAKLMGKPVAEVTKEERAVSKAIVFGVVYGMGPERLADQALLDYSLVWSTEEARNWMERFFGIYTGLRAWRDSLWQEATTATECRSLFLKRRRLLPTGVEQRGYRARCLMNMPAQGTVADAIKTAMINIANELDPEDAIIANLHDELLVEVRKDRAEKVALLVQAKMEESLAGMLSGVPINAAARVKSSL